MSRRAVDITSFVAGIAIALFGVVLLLHEVGAIDLTFAYLAPAVTATAGAVLIARGLGRASDG
jgi:hypothetical protein